MVACYIIRRNEDWDWYGMELRLRGSIGRKEGKKSGIAPSWQHRKAGRKEVRMENRIRKVGTGGTGGKRFIIGLNFGDYFYDMADLPRDEITIL
jgi:hypothetical protein